MPTPAWYKGKVSLIGRWEESSMLICNDYARTHITWCFAMITVVTARRWLHSLWLVSVCINVQFSLCCVCRYRLSLCVWLQFIISAAFLNFEICCYILDIEASSSILHFGSSRPPHELLFVTLLLQTAEICVVHRGVGHTVCCVVGVDFPCVHAAQRSSLDSKSFYKQHISSCSCSAAALKHTGCYF